jgi:AcrR family transcriptional regulator
MTAPSPPHGTLRDRQKAQTRDLIVEAMVEALAAGALEKATHDALAKRIGVARQTVYRHFPDRESLMRALWERVNAQVAVGGLPQDEAALVDMLPSLYANFDKAADLITVARATLQGRAMRLAVRDRRTAAFRKAAAAATADLSPREATMAAAVLQLLHGGQAWIEMREQWGLAGEESAVACGWAIRTLLADLHARKGRPLAEPPEATG